MIKWMILLVALLCSISCVGMSSMKQNGFKERVLYGILAISFICVAAYIGVIV